GKFVEVGLTTKSDNVDFFFEEVLVPRGISAEECAFWGDEFGYLTDCVRGSDAHMITSLTKAADFFDVSDSPLDLPSAVRPVSGGVSAFHTFLEQQIALHGVS
ncbi:MAG: HAD family hydrolase, partial [Spirochaetes bacterium]|nr:HAD family hydrolase [Spirochaetota bacterium]